MARKVLNRVWAKSSGETLVDHTLKVLSVLRQIRERSPRLAVVSGEPRLWHRAFWACVLHDFGKAAAGFQAYLRGEAPPWKHRHEVLSLAFLQALDLHGDDIPWIAAGIVSHHKDAKEIVEERYNISIEPEHLGIESLCRELPEDVLASLIEWLGEAPRRWIAENGFSDAVVPHFHPQPPARFRAGMAGAVMAALKGYDSLLQALDGLEAAAAENVFAIIMRGIIRQADCLASADSPELQSAVFPDRKALSDRIGISEDELMAHQEGAASASGSIILSAPTGSGKTEASLLWARSRQTRRPAQGHLIYVLPYQASLNALSKRLRGTFGLDVALIHSRSLAALYREVLSEGRSSGDAERLARRADSLARLHQPPVWCTTPYHLLRAAYRLPGYESLWASLAGALVVVDEVHAYEPGRMGLFVAMLEELRMRWGAELCIMTATMPSWLRGLLRPLVDAEVSAAPDVFGRFRRHRVELVDGDLFGEKAQGIIGSELASGHSVLVGVNTVKTAQRLWEELAGVMGDESVLLIHGRYTSRDRLAREGFIAERLDARKGSGSPVVVVATQVVEVSLDLDFDTIVTEPAPLEALLQRFGRVNRKGKKGVVPVRVLVRSVDDGGVYEAGLVEKALSILSANDDKVIDEATVGDWIDEMYRGIEDRFTSKARASIKEFRESALRTLRAFQSSEEMRDLFDELFDGTEVLPACLVDEFRHLREVAPIEARSLLVPVSAAQARRHADSMEWNGEWFVRIMDRPYDGDRGLML
ncbi:MAG TPA: CRISPR-associated helicase Cas3' [Deltaproteobacteria bacterium]|nr:CRISPR-associated helicase Cas3' [Deltaproteobacteria bacterium]